VIADITQSISIIKFRRISLWGGEGDNLIRDLPGLSLNPLPLHEALDGYTGHRSSHRKGKLLRLSANRNILRYCLWPN